MQEIKPIRKKRVLLVAMLALLLALLGLVIFLFWPVIQSAVNVERLEDGLYSMEYGGDYGLEAFLEQGGASSDRAVADFVIGRSFHGVVDLNLQGSQFGCSTLLMQQLADSGTMDMDGVRDALSSVSKHNFDSPFASTEWSIVYNQTVGDVRYYHR